jgi:predicted nucleic acid-binding protein
VSGPPLLDTNVLIRHFTNDHAEHSPRATALIRHIADGKAQVRLSETIVFETVFTLEKRYRVPRQMIRDGLLTILALPGMELPGKRIYQEVFQLWLEHPGLSFADSFHVCLAKYLDLEGVISFDENMDHLPEVRIWPPPAVDVAE